MLIVKRIGLEGLKEDITQLIREVDLVKRLSHPSIVKYERMARDENSPRPKRPRHTGPSTPHDFIVTLHLGHVIGLH